MTNLISWFEIPASDLKRAQAFYETILGVEMQAGEMADVKLAVFPYDREKATGGCIQVSAAMRPSQGGSVVYLNAGESIDAVLARVPGAGGKVAVPKTALPEGMGYFANIVDTEGSIVGLHAMK